MKGAAGLVGDALTFKWAQASMAQVAVNTVVVAEVSKLSWESVMNIELTFAFISAGGLLVLYWRVYWQGIPGWIPSLNRAVCLWSVVQPRLFIQKIIFIAKHNDVLIDW